jgi:hypothetical protein
MSLTITWHSSDKGHEYAVLTDDDERVCLPYPLNNLPEPIRLERRDAQGFWQFVQKMTNVEFAAWGAAKGSGGSTRIPRML